MNDFDVATSCTRAAVWFSVQSAVAACRKRGMTARRLKLTVGYLSTAQRGVLSDRRRVYSKEEVRAKTQQVIGPHEDLLTIVKRRTLQWYGLVSRSSGLAKTILQGTVKGGRRQGRQR